MDESDLERRLASIERRLSLVLALLAVGYLFVATAVLVRETTLVTAWHAGVGAAMLLLGATTVGIYRRRRTSA